MMTMLFLGGDVMTGRGIDQIMPFAGDPTIYEACVTDARDYVFLAERANGKIPRAVDFDYIWGDALPVLRQMKPDFRIVNLETAITDNSEPWLDKGINYRMHPGNIPCLVEAGIDCCVLANNHVLDWHYEGLHDTLTALNDAGITVAGAGRNIGEAEQPAVLAGKHKSRVLVFSFCLTSSGVPDAWRAGEARPGVNLLHDLSDHTFRHIEQLIATDRKRSDIVVASIHWGGNWGYSLPDDHSVFARRLIDEAGVNIVHGHSSHHALGVEHYHGRLILYGCGDLINDYEGISGYNWYRGDLSLMYFASVEPSSGELADLTVIPMRIKQFRLQNVTWADIEWLRVMLNRESNRLNSSFVLLKDKTLALSI